MSSDMAKICNEVPAAHGVTSARVGFVHPKSGSYPVAGSAAGGFGGPMTGAIRSLM